MQGIDRASLGLGHGQDELVSAIAAAQPRTVVVVAAPGPFLTPWREQVAAVVTNFMPGQQTGTAIADVLFGDVNPSARLPVTLPLGENDQGFSPGQYPGVNYQSNFTERLLFGYRWYDAHGVNPAFAFGHGLSYTRFSYGSVTAAVKALSSSGPARRKAVGRRGASSSTVAATVSVPVTNAGAVRGAEVAQLYLRFPESPSRPLQEEPPQVLRGFEKVMLMPGQTTMVTFDVTEQDLAIWDVETHNWAQVQGEFTALVGASSRDIRGKVTLNVSTSASSY
jgi:beta-glucosidase